MYIRVRPMQPDDLPAVAAMLRRLSDETRFRRFFTLGRSTEKAELSYLRTLDGHDRRAVIAEAAGHVVGLARYHRGPDGERAEVGIVVEDDWQNHGVGSRMVRRLARDAIERGVNAFTAEVLGENGDARRFLRRVSPDGRFEWAGGVTTAVLPLVGSVPSSEDERLLGHTRGAA